jgi:hypothetical protein
MYVRKAFPQGDGSFYIFPNTFCEEIAVTWSSS